MAGSGYADGNVEVRRDGLAGQPDLPGMRAPAQVAGDTAYAYRPAKQRCELLEHAETLGATQPAAARDDDIGIVKPDSVCRRVGATFDHPRELCLAVFTRLEIHNFAAPRCVGA